jgi:hypothetical protein
LPRLHVWVNKQGNISSPSNPNGHVIDHQQLANYVANLIQRSSKVNLGADIGVICLKNDTSESSISLGRNQLHDLVVPLVDPNDHLVEHYQNLRREEIRNKVCETGQHHGLYQGHAFGKDHLWVVHEESARGLEFTNVIVPNAFTSSTNPQQFLKGLYIACSRAYSGLDIVTDIGLVGGDSEKIKRENMLFKLFDDMNADLPEYFEIVKHPQKAVMTEIPDVEDLPW